jgi:hypothetical protein
MVQQGALLQKMEEALALIGVLLNEKDEAIARLRTLEQENKELQSVMTLADAKADEMLAIRVASGAENRRSAAETKVSEPVHSRPQPANADTPVSGSRAFEALAEQGGIRRPGRDGGSQMFVPPGQPNQPR